MPVDGGALGTVVVVADGDGLGDGEPVWAIATPRDKIPDTPSPATANPILFNIHIHLLIRIRL